MTIQSRFVCSSAVVATVCLSMAGCGDPAVQPSPSSAKLERTSAPNVPPAARAPTAVNTSAGATSSASSTVDLLAKCDIAANMVQGHAQWKDGKLCILRAERFSQIMIPYVPPTRYELEAVVERRDGVDSLSFGIFVGGRPCMLQFDAYGYAGGCTALDLVDGCRPPQREHGESKHAGHLLAEMVPANIFCRVDGDRVEVRVDNKRILDCRIDPNRLSFPPEFTMPNPQAMCLSTCRSQFLISTFQLRPLGDRPAPSTQRVDELAATLPEEATASREVPQEAGPPPTTQPRNGTGYSAGAPPDREPSAVPAPDKSAAGPPAGVASPPAKRPASAGHFGKPLSKEYRVWTLKDGRSQELRFLKLAEDRKRGFFQRKDETVVIAVAIEHLIETDQKLVVPP